MVSVHSIASWTLFNLGIQFYSLEVLDLFYKQICTNHLIAALFQHILGFWFSQPIKQVTFAAWPLFYNLSNVIFIIYLLWRLKRTWYFPVVAWSLCLDTLNWFLLHWLWLAFMWFFFFLVKYSKDLCKHSQDKFSLYWRTSP